jgi:hypothetical protein
MWIGLFRSTTLVDDMQGQGEDKLRAQEGPKGVDDVGGNGADSGSGQDLTAEPPMADVSATGSRKARVVVEYLDRPGSVAADAPESEDDSGEDAGDPATEDLLAGMPDDTEVRIYFVLRVAYLVGVGYRPDSCAVTLARCAALAEVRRESQATVSKTELFDSDRARGCWDAEEARRAGFVR